MVVATDEHWWSKSINHVFVLCSSLQAHSHSSFLGQAGLSTSGPPVLAAAAACRLFITASKMEFPKPSVVSEPILLLLLAVLVMAVEPGIALKLELPDTSSHIPPLLDCAPADDPVPASPSNNNHSAFRANVMSLLAALPPAAAAAPTGFAAAESSAGTTVSNDRAFARASCFASSSPGDSDDCLKYLSAAATDLAGGCCGHGRRRARGAVWRERCFLSYADTDATTAREDAFRGWLYDDDDTDTTPATAASAVVGVGQCVGNRTAMECSRCLNESAQVVPALREGRGRKLSFFHRDAVVVVVGYSCYLRVPPLFTPTTRWETYAVGVFDVVLVLLIEVGGLLFCIEQAREFNNIPE